MTEATRAAAFDDLLTKDELASAIGVSPKTVERWMRKGLPYIKFSRAVRFRRSAEPRRIYAHWSSSTRTRLRPISSSSTRRQRARTRPRSAPRRRSCRS